MITFYGLNMFLLAYLYDSQAVAIVLIIILYSVLVSDKSYQIPRFAVFIPKLRSSKLRK